MIIQNLINQLKMVGWSVLISADVSSKVHQDDEVYGETGKTGNKSEFKIYCDSIFLSKTTDSF